MRKCLGFCFVGSLFFLNRLLEESTSIILFCKLKFTTNGIPFQQCSAGIQNLI